MQLFGSGARVSRAPSCDGDETMFDGLREKKRRNIYAVIMIALLVLTAISANIIAAVILVIMFLLYALSMLSTLYMGEQGVTVTMDVPGETEQGRSVDLTLAVRGARPWYLANLSSHITIQNELTGETMEVTPSFFLLPPGTGRCRPVTISDTHCGRIRITADPVSFTDLLDRVKRDSGTSYETFLYLLPHLELLPERALQMDDGFTADPGNCDPGSGETEEGRTREAGPEGRGCPSAVLTLGTMDRSLSAEEKSRRVSQFLSASFTWLQEGRPHILVWQDGEKNLPGHEEIRCREDLDRAVRDLLDTPLTESPGK